MPKGEEFKPKGEDEIREEIISEYEFNPEDDSDKEKIDKLVNRELDHQTKLGKAISQKKSYRTKLEEALKGNEGEEDGDDDQEGEQPKEKKKEVPQVDTSNFATKEEVETKFHRQKYPNLSDEEYTSINALATSSGKSFEDTVENNPIAKTYFESSEARERLSNVSKAPSTRSSKVDTQTDEDKIADELSADLPIGYSAEDKK